MNMLTRLPTTSIDHRPAGGVLHGINNRLRGGLFCLAVMIMSACSVTGVKDSGPAPGSINVSSIPDATPKVEPRSKYGNPGSYEVLGKRYHVMDSSHGYVERGIASWYGRKFHGRRTSSGETYDMYAMTAAHKSLPLPTYVKVLNLRNGREIIVKVNDRGPFHDNRIIDLSYVAAAKLGIIENGTGLVEVRAINPRNYREDEGRIRQVAARVTNEAGFYIQVGAFTQILNAVNLRDRLASISLGTVHISEAVVDDTQVYRVRIGPIMKVDVADRIVARLGRYGVFEHHIIVD